MPYVMPAVLRANRYLDGIDPEVQEGALQVVAAASNTLEAAEGAGLFEHLDEARQREARAAIAALPPSVDAALLAVVRSGVERKLPVVIQWKPGFSSEIHAWESVEGNAGHVGILLTTPLGRDLPYR